ncbi:MAG: RNA polymerase sigma factor FliA [Gammaproteobacteria bacterium]|nr:RNA polymerase sigma factor FliA [Pseudomonadales bacterium]MCP5349037.1 RNA polymerase sigma factor FliA [Pseudomonadales bacterium]
MNLGAQSRELGERFSRDQLFEDNMSLVTTIAHHIGARLPAGKSVDDLIQVGLIGLLEAVRSYEPKPGVDFKAYANIRIRGAIIDELRRETWVPRSVQQKSRHVAQAIQDVENRLGRTATDKEIARELNLNLEEYGGLLEEVASCTLLSLDDENVFSHPVTDEDEIIDRIHYDALKTRLAELIGQLPEQEKLVVALYYDYGLNLREIGEVLDVSESRACQVHSQAMSRLRIKLRNQMNENDIV